MQRLVLLAVFSGVMAWGQVWGDPTPAPAPKPEPAPAPVAAPAVAYPSTWYGVGAAWNSAASPKFNGWGSLAILAQKSVPLYSFTSYDVNAVRSGKGYQLKDSARTGVAMVIKQIGPANVLALGDAGAATSNTATTGAFSGGGGIVVKLGGGKWTLCGFARVLKINGSANQTVYELGFGRTN